MDELQAIEVSICADTSSENGVTRVTGVTVNEINDVRCNTEVEHGVTGVTPLIEPAAEAQAEPADGGVACPDACEREPGDAAPVDEAAAEAEGAFDAVPAKFIHPYPGLEARPCWRVFDNWIECDGRRLQPGVWYFGIKPGKPGKEPPTPTDTWVCSPLHVDAITHDAAGNNYGRLLRFRTSRGRWRTWAMPMAMLRGSGEELRGELLSMGVEIDPIYRHELAHYLQNRWPKRFMLCVQQIGWAGVTFVLPDAAFGLGADGVVFQSESVANPFTTGGTLEGWRVEVARLAVGNPVMALAISTAFAGPLLAKVCADSGGLHLVGGSSTGKTTALEAARSVWGPRGFVRTWRATANGLEAAAALSNDCLLALDEISEVDPRDAGEIVYLLGNGAGKQRADRTGRARQVAHWRVMILSTGERTLAATMAEAGLRVKAGQQVRLLDIPVQRTHGAFDALHGHPDGRALADAVKAATNRHYGHAGRAFLERLTRDCTDFGAALAEIRASDAFRVDGTDGQLQRAASRLALVALAGEVATSYDLTGWPPGEAINAAAWAFAAWRQQRGHRGQTEPQQILRLLADFIERHGDARFSYIDAKEAVLVRDRAGWYRIDGDARTYLMTASALREATRGYDLHAVLLALQEHGVIDPPGPDGRYSRPVRVGGAVHRLYAVRGDRLLDAAAEA